MTSLASTSRRSAPAPASTGRTGGPWHDGPLRQPRRCRLRPGRLHPERGDDTAVGRARRHRQSREGRAMTDPRTISDRELAISRLSTDRPRRDMRQVTPKSLAWMEKHLGAPFIDARATAERVRAEYEA